MIFSGPATITHGVSAQDPLYRLPVRRMLGGFYIACGAVDELDAKVIKSYI